MADTNDIQDTSEVEGKNTESSEGTLDTDTNNTDKHQEEKTLKQSEVNDIVKRAKQDAERAAKTKFEKSLEGKHIFTEEEKDKLIKDAVTAALKEESLKSVRTKIQSEYGLNDYQVSKLEGDDEKSLKEDAEKTYGKPKKSAPVLNGGGDTREESNGDPDDALIAQALKDAINSAKKR